MGEPRLIRLRIELYAAAQTLQGDDAEEFWRLIEEIWKTRVLFGREKGPDA